MQNAVAKNYSQPGIPHLSLLPPVGVFTDRVFAHVKLTIVEVGENPNLRQKELSKPEGFKYV